MLDVSKGTPRHPRDIEDAIKSNEEILYFSNLNDFLLRPEDMEWSGKHFAIEPASSIEEDTSAIGELARD